MTRVVLTSGTAVLAAFALLTVGGPQPRQDGSSSVVVLPEIDQPPPQAPAQRPLVFEQNRGQTDRRAAFLTRGQGYTAFLTSRGPVLSILAPTGKSRPTETPVGGRASLLARTFRSTALSLRFVGARPSRPQGLHRSAAMTTYLRSRRIDAPMYERAVQRNVYPGIDVLYLGRKGDLRYDWLVSPGADPGRIELELKGADALRVGRDGGLVATVDGLTLRHRPPVAYQRIDGARRLVTSRWAVRGRNAKFALGRYDRTHPLVIDPTLSSHRETFVFGGTQVDVGLRIAELEKPPTQRDPWRLLAGFTNSPDFPGSNRQPVNLDAFAAAFDGELNQLQTFVFGGSGNDSIEAIVPLGPNTVVLAGGTNSPDFPVLNAFDPTFGGGFDSFVTIFDPATGQVTRSSYWGGSGNDSITGGFELNGNTFGLHGYSSEAPFGGPYDALFGLFDATGNLSSSRFLGGAGNDAIFGGDSSGNTIVLGGGSSPSTGAIEQPSLWTSTNGGESFSNQVFPGGSSDAYFQWIERVWDDKWGAAVNGPFPGSNTGACSPPACGPVGVGIFRVQGGIATRQRYTTYVPRTDGILHIPEARAYFDAQLVRKLRAAVAVQYRPTPDFDFGLGRLWSVLLQPEGVKLEKQVAVGSGDVFLSGVAVSKDGTTYVTGGALPGSFPPPAPPVKGPVDVFIVKLGKFLRPCTCMAIKTTGSGYGDISSPRRGTRVSFRVNWEMACSAGDGQCNGEIRVVGPGGDVRITQPRRNVSCKGTCPAARAVKAKGRFVVRATSRNTLDPERRAGKRFVYKLHKWCIVNGKRVSKPFGTVIVAYNAFGSLDRRNSDLNGNGRPDFKDRRRR